MAKTSSKKKNPEALLRQKQQDALTYKVLIVVVATFVSIFVVRFLEGLFNNGDTSWGTYYFFCAVAVIGAALIVFGVVMLIVNLIRRGRIGGMPLKAIVAGILLFASGALVYKLGSYAFVYLMFIFPAYGVFFLVYYIFQREFFLITLLSGADVLLLFALSRNLGGSYAIAGVAAAVAVCVIVGVFSALASKKDGMLCSRKEGVTLFGKNAIYPPVYITCAGVIVTALVALFAGALAAYILMFVLIAYFIAMAVYYATKLL